VRAPHLKLALVGQYLQNLSRKRQRPWSWARPDSDDNSWP